MPEFRYGNAAVHYGDNGNGAPLLLLHSGGSSGAQWRKAGEKLTARRLLTPDFYGYGGTDGSPTRTSDERRSYRPTRVGKSQQHREAGENKLFGEYEFLVSRPHQNGDERDAWAFFRHVLCRGLPRGRATHQHTGRRQLCPLRRQHVAGRLQIIVTGLAVVRLSLCPRLVSPGSYEAAGQIGPLPRPQDALYEPERRWARYADHRILHLIVAERIFYRRLPSNRCNSLCLRRGQRENPNWTQAS